jgi:hypothetical protein
VESGIDRRTGRFDLCRRARFSCFGLGFVRGSVGGGVVNDPHPATLCRTVLAAVSSILPQYNRVVLLVKRKMTQASVGWNKQRRFLFRESYIASLRAFAFKQIVLVNIGSEHSVARMSARGVSGCRVVLASKPRPQTRSPRRALS